MIALNVGIGIVLLIPRSYSVILTLGDCDRPKQDEKWYLPEPWNLARSWLKVQRS